MAEQKEISDTFEPPVQLISPQNEEDVDPLLNAPFHKRVGNLSLEFFLILFIIGIFTVMTPKQDLFLEKACRNVCKYNDSICSDIDNDKYQDTVDYKILPKFSQKLRFHMQFFGYLSFKTEVEQVVTKYSTFSDITGTLLAVPVSIFAASYSARYGVKYMMLASSIGIWIAQLGTMATIYNFQWPLWANILVNLPEGLSGGFIVVLTGVYTNATFAVPKTRRRLRFFVIDLAMGIAISVSSFLGGQLYKRFGLISVYWFTSSILPLSVLYLLFVYKDITAMEEHKNDTLKTRLKVFFSFEPFVESYRTVTRERPNGNRSQIISLFFVMGLIVFATMATGNLPFLYVRHLYNWSVVQYASFQSINIAIGVTLGFLTVILFTKAFKLTDLQMILTGLMFGVSKFIFLSMAFLGVGIYYLQAILGVPLLISTVGIRSHLSKLVDHEEVGSVMAFLSSCERAIPIAGDLVNAIIFSWSLSFWPGFVYAVDAVLMGIAFITVLYANLGCFNCFKRKTTTSFDVVTSYDNPISC